MNSMIASFLQGSRLAPMRVMAACAALVIAADFAQAQPSVLYSFKGGTDGALPVAGLILDSGALYGTTSSGGGGTVFKLTPPTETPLYRFCSLKNCPDGAYPQAGVIADPKGALYGLYGTTSNGGDNGFGTVFKLTPPTAGQIWTRTPLYSFKGGTDGGRPLAGLMFDKYGNLYGTTSGTKGTVFMLTAKTWTFHTIYNFCSQQPACADGADPHAGVIADPKGVFYGLYGTTHSGGKGFGTVFKLTPPTAGRIWTRTPLYNFPGGTDGSGPVAGLSFDNLGGLYGTTSGISKGTVFTLILANGQWHFHTIYNFCSQKPACADGADPHAGVIADLANPKGVLYGLYGTTYSGGDKGYGTVFKLIPPANGQPPWTRTTLYSFTGTSDGGRPAAGLLDAAGALYGTTFNGGNDGHGSPLNNGTVFELK